MKKKVKLADVLWDAANVRLAATEDQAYDGASRTEKFSCYAATAAAGDRYVDAFDNVDRSATIRFLRSLGCDFDSTAWEDLDGTLTGNEIQGVRYMWLLLAMHVAEDEGIEIEVDA